MQRWGKDMHTNIIRWSLGAALGISLFASTIATAGSAHAAERTSHPDFAWLPTSAPAAGHRLYVGNLSMNSSD
jgi:hypothetical protein